MAFLGSRTGGAALGLGGGLMGRAGSGLFDILNQPQQAVNSALMFAMGRQPTYPTSGSPRQAAQGLSGMMGMASPGFGGVGGSASAASMAAGVEGMPHVIPSDFESILSSPGDARRGSLMPALLGLLAGGATFLTPLSPFAVPVGAAAAGLAQKLMNSQDPGQYGSFSTSEVLDQAGFDPDAWHRPILDFGFGMASDPLAWGGLAGGLKANAALSQASAVEPRLAAFARQARGAKPLTGELSGIGRIGGGLPEPAILPPALQGPSGLAPLPIEELALAPNEITPLREALQARMATPGRLAPAGPAPLAEAALPQTNLMSQPPAVPQDPRMMPLPVPPELQGPGPRTFMDQLKRLTREVREKMAVGTSPIQELQQAAQMPAPASLGAVPPPLPGGAPSVRQMMLDAAAQARPPAQAARPFALPAPANAGLGEAYPAAAFGNVPLSPGAPGYRLIDPEVQALLEQLGVQGIPRGGLPPWARLQLGRGGSRVVMSPEILPEDILRGSLGAAGYQ